MRGGVDEWFLAAHLVLEHGDVAAAQARIKALLDRRGQTQPIGLPSCGSVFRNPPGDHAARLIEAAGLKGECVGGACVSEKHANFIINTGAASAADIERLIEQVRDTVHPHARRRAATRSAHRRRSVMTRPRSIPRDFGKVAVLMGGRSAEREISLKSGNAVLQALRNRGVDAHGIDAQADVIEQLRAGGFDPRFHCPARPRRRRRRDPGAHWKPSAMPYTGSGVLGSALGMDKLRCKRLWQAAGLPTPDYEVLHGDSDFAHVARRLGFAVDRQAGARRFEHRHDPGGAHAGAGQAPTLQRRGFDDEVIAEHWVHGGEYTAAILDRQPLPLIRLETPNAFYDFEAKYRADSTRYHCPCGLPAEQEAQLQRLALQAFDVVGAAGWGRVDLMLDRQQRPWLIEVNTVPGMTDHSLVPMAAKTAGIDFDELVLAHPRHQYAAWRSALMARADKSEKAQDAGADCLGTVVAPCAERIGARRAGGCDRRRGQLDVEPEESADSCGKGGRRVSALE